MVFAAGLALVLSGCNSTGSGTETTTSSPRSTSRESANERKPDLAIVSQADKSHVIGPTLANSMDYRVAWQNEDIGRNLKLLTVQGDSAYGLDEKNYLTRIRVDDGQRLWRTQVAAPIEEIIGLNVVGKNVCLTTGGELLVLDGATGGQIGKQPFEKIANTWPVEYGQFLIYGSRNGQVIWHSHQIAYQWRGYAVAQSIQVPPVLVNDYLVAIGNDGMVMVLNAATATQYWSKRLLDKVVAAPAADQNAVYVASTDQHLWAYDISSGRNLWRVLTESPLTDSPTLIGNRVYQQIPSEGLVCFNAMPLDSPGGERIWASKGLKGNVITKRRDDVLVWDAPAQKLHFLESKRGAITKTIDLPQANRLIVAGKDLTDLYAVNNDGRLVRLVSR